MSFLGVMGCLAELTIIMLDHCRPPEVDSKIVIGDQVNHNSA